MEQIPLILLKNEHVVLTPLQEVDFERLFKVAADPLIWEQHPNPDRYQRPAFQKYFEGALKSEGAYIISEAKTGTVIGSSRYYDFSEKDQIIKIGYTFFSRDCWGKSINKEVKWLMLDYAFTYVERVHFEVGANNIRSQIAMERLGAVCIGEQEVAYYGEQPKLNLIYEMKKREQRVG
jgi:RimJ/RimL family protein N-acetyltransferase